MAKNGRLNSNSNSLRRLIEKDISVDEYVDRLRESAQERKNAGSAAERSTARSRRNSAAA